MKKKEKKNRMKKFEHKLKIQLNIHFILLSHDIQFVLEIMKKKEKL